MKLKVTSLEQTKLTLKVKYESNIKKDNYYLVLNKNSSGEWYVDFDASCDMYENELAVIADVLKKLNAGEINKIFSKSLKVTV